MKKDVNEEFDSRMRSMLLDAEVKAPSGVWKAVSSRLETKPAFSWGWVAAPLAFASIALGIILFRVNPGVPASHPEALALLGEPAEIEAAVPEAAVLRKSFPARTAFEAVREASGTVSEASETALEAPEAVRGTSGAAREAETVRETEISSPQRSSGSVASPAREVSSEQPVSQFVDPFAEMAREDASAKKDHRISLNFGGTVSGSENGRSLIATRTSGVAATSLQDNIVETSTSTFGIPFTIGIGARLGFAKKFSVGTGLDFSLLTRTFTGQYTPAGGTMTEGDITHTMIYLGIPVDFHFNILSSKSMKFYTFLGGEIEFAVSNRYNIRSLERVLSEDVSKPQFSVGGGLGVEFKIGPRLGLYLDPGVNYYFNTNQPKSVRTERPLMFNLDGGLRFNF